MKKTYQILFKGVYTNKLTLIETDNFELFKQAINNFQKGNYKNLVLLETNTYN